MISAAPSLEEFIHSSSRALVIGVGGGGDVVGALATARFLEFCGLKFHLGGLSWERSVYDPVPGPRRLDEVIDVRPIHRYAWLANAESKTSTGVYFAESRMAEFRGEEVLLIDINGGVQGVVEGLQAALEEFKADLLVGVDVGGDSLAQGGEPGLRSPLADSIMLAAYKKLEELGQRTLWGVFGYGSDGEMTVEEIESALNRAARAGGLFGAWALTKKSASELESVIQKVPTEASAIPAQCFRGAWGETKIRQDQRSVKLTPLTTLTFFLSPTIIFDTLSRPAQAVRESSSLEEANQALHAIGLKTELDLEREKYEAGAGR
ncbi:MAG TPA: DUF1152 domain-containing protein [Candidatus Binatia bacterium]|jgi:hypothetical protein|nr:DUF1152 domain-containing protein [Candidatus Binatia bacterium]